MFNPHSCALIVEGGAMRGIFASGVLDAFGIDKDNRGNAKAGTEGDQSYATNVPGVFAAGDCVGRFLQISVAVGEGALAGRAAINHVKDRRRALLDKSTA